MQLPPNLPALSAAFSLFSEKCVMNNYFGIGLDAKISLEFNNKRDEHPKKCRLAEAPPPDSPRKTCTPIPTPGSLMPAPGGTIRMPGAMGLARGCRAWLGAPS